MVDLGRFLPTHKEKAWPFAHTHICLTLPCLCVCICVFLHGMKNMPPHPHFPHPTYSPLLCPLPLLPSNSPPPLSLFLSHHFLPLYFRLFPCHHLHKNMAKNLLSLSLGLGWFCFETWTFCTDRLFQNTWCLWHDGLKNMP